MQNTQSELHPDFSLYLDAARFTAALFVVIKHLIMAGLVDRNAAAFIPVLGREAVMVFFVLSGFVIMYSVDRRHTSLQEYVVARGARIYSAALPVLLAAFAVAGFALSMSVVSLSEVYQLAKPYIYIPLHLLFMGEFWNLAETPPWLIPYWSLGYEVWYYVIFGAAYYARGMRRVVVVLILLLLVGFKLWLLLPVWLSGVALYHWSRSHSVPPSWARVGWWLSIAGLCLYKLIDADLFLRELGIGIWKFDSLKLGSADRYLGDYVVCALVLLNFACARSLRFPLLQTMAAPIRVLAACTFTLYLVHDPVLTAWKHFYPHDTTSVIDIALALVAVGVATYFATLVTERCRDVFKRAFSFSAERLARR